MCIFVDVIDTKKIKINKVLTILDHRSIFYLITFNMRAIGECITLPKPKDLDGDPGAGLTKPP